MFRKLKIDKLSPKHQNSFLDTLLRENKSIEELYESEYDNHPWNGKLSNGRKCKEGTYYYKIEYILNPELPEDTQNETKFSTGTVFLTWGN